MNIIYLWGVYQTIKLLFDSNKTDLGDVTTLELVAARKVDHLGRNLNQVDWLAWPW